MTAPVQPAEAWAALMSKPARRVLVALRARAEAAGGVAVMTYNEIAMAALIARSQVNTALDELVRLGLVERAGSVPNPRGHPTNAYRCREVFVVAGGELVPIPPGLAGDSVEVFQRRANDY